MSMFWKSLEGNNQIFLPVNWFFSMKWLNSKSEYYDSDLRLPQHILWKCPCFTNPGSWHLKVMIWDTPPAPILECLTFKTENLIQLYIIRKCLFCYCATWIMWWRVFMFVCFLLFFFFWCTLGTFIWNIYILCQSATTQIYVSHITNMVLQIIFWRQWCICFNSGS